MPHSPLRPGVWCLLVGLKEEAVFTVVDYGYILVLGRFSGRELNVSKNPGLSL
jgi:hypothetical protein